MKVKFRFLKHIFLPGFFFALFILIYLAVSPLILNKIFAGSCSSAQTGPWATGSTWGAGCTGTDGIPAAADTVTILNTHIVTIALGISAEATAVVVNSGGTLEGTGDITVSGGSVTGDGTINMTGGTFLVDGTGNFGGSTGWNFNNLTFGNGAGATTTSTTGAGAITVSGSMAVATAQTLDAGLKTWNLTGIGGSGSASIAKVQDVFRDGFQGFNSATSGTLGATPTSGNFLFASVFLAENGAERVVTPPSGWTMLKEYAEGTDYSMGVYYKVAGGSESTTYTWTWDDSSVSQVIYLAEFSGNDTTTPIDVSDAAWTDSGFSPASPIIVPAITTVTDGAMDILVVNNQAQGPGYACSTSGYTEEVDGAAFAVYTKENPTAGSTGTRSVTVPNIFDVHTYSFAIRPGSGGASSPLTVSGTFTPNASTVNFAGTSATTIPALIYNNVAFIPVSGSPTYTLASGTHTAGGTFTVGNGSNAVTVTGGSSTINVTGAFNVAASGVFTSTSGTLTLGANFTNSGTFTHNSGTVVFNGSGISTLAGATTFNNFTAATAGQTVKFTSGQTFRVNGLLNLTGTGSASNQQIHIDSSNGSTQWFMNHHGTESVAFVELKNSGCDAGSTAITMDSDSVNTLNNNTTCWVFPSGGGGITISGVIFSNAGSSALDCSTGGNRTVRIKVNGAGTYSGDCSLNTGVYSIPAVTVAAGNVITVFLDGETEKAVTITRAADDSSNITGLNLYQNYVIARHEDGGPITNANLDQYDANNGACASGTGDSDIQFCVVSGVLTIASGNTLFLWNGDTLTPGGNVSTPVLAVDGALSGTTDFTVLNGGATGNGTINLTGGTFLVDGTGNFGGATGWNFNNLTFGNGAGATTTSTTGAGAITVSGSMAVVTAQTLDAGLKTWNLTGSGAGGGGSGFQLISNVKGISGFDADSFTTSSIDTTGADLLVMAVASTDTTITPSDSKGNTWTLAVKQNHFLDETIYYAWNATIGTNHTFTMTGTDITASMQVYAFSGSQTSSDPKDQSNVNAAFGSTTLQPGSVTPTTDGQLIMTADNHNSTIAATINSSFTSPSGAGNGYGETNGDFGHINSHSAYLVQTTAAAVNPTWTAGNSNHYAAIATFKAGPAGSSAPLTVSGTFTPNASTVNFAGTSAVAIPALTYNNVAFIPVSGSPTYTLASGTHTAGGTFTVGNGSNAVTVTAATNNPAINVVGNFQVSAGTAAFTSTSGNLTLGDDFTNSGTFTHNSGTVVLNTTATAVVAGATTFNNLTIATGNKTVNFTAGQTFTTNGVLTITGTSGNLVNIGSTTSSQWLINHQGTESVNFASVINSGCDVSSTTITTTNSTGGGNNGACWMGLNAPPSSPPTVSISSPTNGSTVSGNVAITANASDNVGVAGVQFKMDGNNLGSEDTTSPYTIDWDTTTASNGSHSLTAIARNTSNDTTTSSTVSVTVNNAVATPATCNLISPSFCDNFNQGPSPIRGRAGDLDPAKWAVGRLAPSDFSGFAPGLNAVPVAIIPACKSSFLQTNVYPPNDTLICDSSGTKTAQLLTAVAVQNYGNNSYMIRQPFDFAGRTGKITFDVDAMSAPLGGYIAIDITEDPIPAPTFQEANNFEVGPLPRNAIMLKFANRCGSDFSASPYNTIVYDDYVGTIITPTLEMNGTGCPTTALGSLNHFEIQLSQNHIDIYGSDFSTDNGQTYPNYRLIYSANVSLPFTRGYVHMAARNHATLKYSCGTCGANAWVYHWDNIGFDGPILPTERAYEIPDNTNMGVNQEHIAMDLGYLLRDSTGGFTPGIYDPNNRIPSLDFQNVNTSDAAGAKLSLNTRFNTSFQPADTTWGISYRFNNGTWRNRTFTPTEVSVINNPVGIFGNLSMMIDVPVGDLVSGINTLELLPLNAPMDFPPAVANIDLTLTLSIESPDTTSPSTPTGLTATAISTSQINLSWTASTDDVSVTGYKIYRDSVLINTSSVNNYSDTGLTVATTYSYAVSAYDAAVNNSSQSTSASATTTQAIPPPPPPPPPTPVVGQGGGSRRIDGSDEDEDEVAIADVNDPGCFGGNAFSTMTGDFCAVSLGCGSGNMFSPITGQFCGIPVIPIGNGTTTVITTNIPVGPFSYNFGTALVKQGSTSESCRAWQNFFNVHRNAGLVVDGMCGPLTMAAARSWQASSGLVADGLLGPMSRAEANRQASMQ